MRNTMIAAAALAGLTAVPNVGQAEGYSYGNAFLVTAGVGVPASVGDYGEDTDPKFSIPINVTGPIHKRLGWIASYSFNRLKPAGGDLAEAIVAVNPKRAVFERDTNTLVCGVINVLKTDRQSGGR